MEKANDVTQTLPEERELLKVRGACWRMSGIFGRRQVQGQIVLTDQRIIFRGADDPTKVKSIKFAVGWAKYLWYEEVNEFEGAEKIRCDGAQCARLGVEIVSRPVATVENGFVRHHSGHLARELILLHAERSVRIAGDGFDISKDTYRME